jgi:hypothetical protein
MSDVLRDSLYIFRPAIFLASQFAKLLPDHPSYPQPAPKRITLHAAQLAAEHQLFGGHHVSVLL